MKVGNKFPSKSRSSLFQLQHVRFFAREKNLTPAGERSGTNNEAPLFSKYRARPLTDLSLDTLNFRKGEETLVLKS